MRVVVVVAVVVTEGETAGDTLDFLVRMSMGSW